MYYDRAGKPMSVLEWAQLFEDREGYGRVAFDKVGDAEVSTVWLGLDHSHGRGGPLIFETMVFGGQYSELQHRHKTEQDATLWHRAFVSLLRIEHGGQP